jgi:hypothetical protein
MGHHYAIWASDSNILPAQKKKFWLAKGWPSFHALNMDTSVKQQAFTNTFSSA